MYAIKIMSAENKPDSDVGKGFKMIMVAAGDTFEFGHDQTTGEPQVTVTGERAGEPTCTTYPVTGNCYVLSETGKTIATFWGRSLWGRREVRVELDPRDPNPERTVESIQSIITETPGKANDLPPTSNLAVELFLHSQCETRREQFINRGLNDSQIELILKGPTKLPNSAVEREKLQRSRSAYLTTQGIPLDIAMSTTMYIIDLGKGLDTRP